MPVDANYQAKPIYLELGDGFADPVLPANFPKQILRFRNQVWATRMGLAGLNEAEWCDAFARFQALPGNLPEPLAMRYHGHQFRHYNPDLGDGRGFLFAQLADGARVLDLGTKGSGQTPYSRRGDGRLTLKGAVREVLATEMLEALGVNTSKTFSVFETGEELERHDEPSPTRSAVLVRLGHSHIRFGTFQRFAALKDQARIEQLIAYCFRHYLPIEAGAESSARFLSEVVRRSADLSASWMIAGFVHGVLNTDNLNITGESFDYGPYRFLPKLDPAFTAAYFDQHGLYAYGRQPEAVMWNLQQLAGSLRGLATEQTLTTALEEFVPRFNEQIARRFLLRLGVEAMGDPADSDLFAAGIHFLSASQADFAQFFHDCYGGAMSQARWDESPQHQLYTGEHFEVFFRLLQDYKGSAVAARALATDYFLRPRPCGLLIDEIEWIWEAIAARDDWSRFEHKLREIREMSLAYGTATV